MSKHKTTQIILFIVLMLMHIVFFCINFATTLYSAPTILNLVISVIYIALWLILFKISFKGHIWSFIFADIFWVIALFSSALLFLSSNVEFTIGLVMLSFIYNLWGFSFCSIFASEATRATRDIDKIILTIIILIMLLLSLVATVKMKQKKANQIA